MRKLLKFSLILCLACGCVERSFAIRTPEPCELFIDGKPAGMTPYEAEFTYYGTHEIMLRDKEGGITVRDIRLSTPWYEFFPLDLLAEFLYPARIVSRFVFDLNPAGVRTVDLDGVEQRAAAYRDAYDSDVHED